MTGIFFYYLLWPLVWLYSPLRVRVHAVVTVGDEVLAVKNWFGPGRWQLPGGGKKRTETPIAAARRELSEELGVELAVDGTDLSFHVMPHFQYGLLFHSKFVWFELDRKPKMTLSKELTEVGWRPVAELPFLPDDVRHQITP